MLHHISYMQNGGKEREKKGQGRGILNATIKEEALNHHNLCNNAEAISG
jgi:hypothetical protein